MTQHIMTNGNGILGTAGTIQMSTVATVRDLRAEVHPGHRWRELCVDLDHVVGSSEVSGKRLSKRSFLKDSGSSAEPSCYCSSKRKQFAAPSGIAGNVAELPAAAWASFVISRTDSYGAVSL